MKLLTALALLVVYAQSAWLIFHPSTSPEYTLYYRQGALRRWPGPNGLKYRPGAKLDFSTSLVYLSRQGWSEPEGWGGTWSDGPAASVFLKVEPRSAAALELTLQGHAFVNPQHPLQRVEVLANGTTLGTLRYDDPSPTVRTLAIPGAVLQGAQQGILNLTLLFPDACAPAELGLSPDTRKLGVGITSMRLTP
ncbi:hypothetical protein [Paraburkholderia sp. DGU8]|jgi:hypothetical protein|uniref:DUF7024 domain-containing protein n=1 Tax=Paraburkholderia sp. DGU8 TaxID=3161997 RepID=UPI003466EA25